MNTPLLVGCPIAKREWAISLWFAHLEASTLVDYEAIFVADEKDPTVEVIVDTAKQWGRKVHFVWTDETDGPHFRHPHYRQWTDPRYRRMVEIRNLLLAEVRRLGPEVFLSLDSDIMLHPNAIAGMLEGIDFGYDAVGSRCYMTYPDTLCTSGAMLMDEHLARCHFDYGPTPVDVIMAVKMMAPTAYAIDYEFHKQGEDTGWCIACRRAGLRLAWDGRYTSKHCMVPSMIDRVDPRSGF